MGPVVSEQRARTRALGGQFGNRDGPLRTARPGSIAIGLRPGSPRASRCPLFSPSALRSHQRPAGALTSSSRDLPLSRCDASGVPVPFQGLTWALATRSPVQRCGLSPPIAPLRRRGRPAFRVPSCSREVSGPRRKRQRTRGRSRATSAGPFSARGTTGRESGSSPEAAG
jgi:hypothetical protein